MNQKLQKPNLQEKLQKQKATLTRNKHYLALEDGNPALSSNAYITYVPLSHKDIQDVRTLLSEKQSLFTQNIILSFANITYNNIQFTQNIINDYDKLSYIGLDVEIFIEHLLDISIVTSEDVDKVELAFDFYNTKTFQADDWNCDVCRAKYLDKSRNCKYLDDEEYKKNFDNTFLLMVKNKKYTYCPVYDIDKDMYHQAMEAHTMYDKGLLPDIGSVYNQTEFFSIMYKVIGGKINELEAESNNNSN
jgi:hypothetical protein